MYISNFIIFIICSLFLINQIVYLYNKGINLVSLSYIFYFFVFIVPIGLQLVIDEPDYSRFYGFDIATRDSFVNFLYLFSVLLSSIIFYLFRGKSSFSFEIISNNKIILILFCIAFLPLFYLFFAPNIELYGLYGGKEIRSFNAEENDFHSNLVVLTFLSCISSAYLTVYSFKKNWFIFFLLPIIFFLDVWLNGKRVIFLLFVTTIIFLIFLKNKKINIKSMFIAIILLSSFFTFSNWYQNNVRDYSEKNIEEKYLNFRIDYFRDQRVKMALYSTLYPDSMKILEYSGQSYVFTMGVFVPRSIWINKPYPYPHYFTSSLLNLPPDQRAWTMTTSWFDEFISNFGILGILFGPLFYVYFIRLGVKFNNPYLSLLTGMLAAIYLFLHMLTFISLLILWIILILKSKFRFKL